VLGIEPRSFIIVSAAFGSLCAFIFFALRSGFPRDIKGLARWGWACAIMAAAALLFSSRGIAPAFFSSFIPNLLVAAGVVAMHGSIRQFGGAPPTDGRLLALFLVAALALAFFTLVDDDYRSRVLVMSAALALLFAACGWASFRLRDKGFAERFTGFMFAATACVMLARWITALFQGGIIPLTVETDTAPMQQVYMASFSFSIVALSVGFLLMVNRALQRKLESLALRDQQTGALRRDAFLALLDAEIAASRLQRRPMALLMMDLDDFKAINDRHGHLVGDRVISDFTDRVRQVLRRNDAIGRYGGEEFLVLFPDTGEADAHAIAARILAGAAQARRDDIPVYTVSIGVALLDARHDDAAAIIDAADKALYAAKKAGKNRIETAPASDGARLAAA
jgi:diguanylate cyclase (GGDEF)-like protein